MSMVPEGEWDGGKMIAIGEYGKHEGDQQQSETRWPTMPFHIGDNIGVLMEMGKAFSR